METYQRTKFMDKLKRKTATNMCYISACGQLFTDGRLSEIASRKYSTLRCVPCEKDFFTKLLILI